MKCLRHPIEELITAPRASDELLVDGEPFDVLRIPVLRARDKRFFVELEKRVAEGTVVYPILPETTVEVLRLIDDPDAPMTSIEAALDQDITLSDEILRNANSVWFGARTTVQDTHGALMRLGKRNLRNILLGVSLKLSLVQGPGSITSIGEGLWRHSMATGAVARLLATALASDRDHWFLSGLMHDLGQVALLATVRDIIQTTIRGYSPRAHILSPILRWYHQPVGRIAATHWQLPEDMIASVAHHHRPRRAGKYARLAGMVNVANFLTHLMESQDEHSEPVEDPSILTQTPGGRILELNDAMASRMLHDADSFFGGIRDHEAS